MLGAEKGKVTGDLYLTAVYEQGITKTYNKRTINSIFKNTTLQPIKSKPIARFGLIMLRLLKSGKTDLIVC